MTQEALLKQANDAMRQQEYQDAVKLYAEVLVRYPVLGRFISANLYLAAKAYRTNREHATQPKVAVCGWSLGHNPAGRVYTLATIYEGFAETEIIGSLFPKFGSEIWSPLCNCSLPIHGFVVNDDACFLQQAIEFVASHPYDLVHLSKPRGPNIIFGMLYKLLWGAAVIMDVDDEELAFVGADTPLSLNNYLAQHGKFPSLQDLTGKTWTQFAVGLVNQFDAITVCNNVLQQRYGGSIVHHARNASKFKPSVERRKQARAKFGIAKNEIVVIFAGTPRAHKGLLETAEAIAQQQYKDLVFMVVGSFSEKLCNLQQQIANIPSLKTIMLPDQSFQELPEILAAGDVSVLLQDPDSIAAQYQTPAKLTDALAMGLTVLATPTPALKDLGEKGAFIPTPAGQLYHVLRNTLVMKNTTNTSPPIPHPLFTKLLTTKANEDVLLQVWRRTPKRVLHKVSYEWFKLVSGWLQKHPTLQPVLLQKKPPIDENNFPSARYVHLNQELIEWRNLSKKVRQVRKVSIIIPIYNQIELTKKCLESVLNAKNKIEYEVICVNNGSDIAMDEFLSNVCRKESRIKNVKNPENYNFSLGCNIGFAQAVNSIIVFLNNDTEVTDGWLDELIKPLREESIVAVQPKLLYPDSTIQNIGIVFTEKQVFGYPIYAGFDSMEPCTNISRRYQAVTGACMAVRARDFIRVQGFDPLFINGMEDVDLCLRLSQGSQDSCYYQASSVVFHHESKTKGRSKYINLNRHNFFKRWHGYIKPDDKSFYHQDGYEIVDWKRDSKEKIFLNIAIHRPVLNKFCNKISGSEI